MKKCKQCAVYKKIIDDLRHEYEERISDLEEQQALLRFELEQFRSKRYKFKKKPKDTADTETLPELNKKGGVFGHKGWFRKKPKKIDKVEEVRLKKCPECGSNDIREYKGRIKIHIQEDIVMPVVETTEFRKHLYYCKGCQRTVLGKGTNELAKSYIGPLAKAWAVFIKYGIKVSDRDIKKLFKGLFNLDIAVSSIDGFRDQLRVQAKDVYKKLIELLKRGEFIHADETGANLNGKNGWRWKFSNKDICVTRTDTSRGQKVVEEVLGEKFDGVIISDFLSAYNKIVTKAKQRCLVHLLRDLKKVIDYWQDDKEVLRYCEKLKDILKDSIKLHKEYKDKTWDKYYREKRERLTDMLEDFNFPNPSKKVLQRFVKRLKRHKGELLTFLYHQDIDYHNNHAEQQIRPDVLLRKVTFGNRSENGITNRDVFMSILQTCRLNNIDFVHAIKDIILKGKNISLSKILALP